MKLPLVPARLVPSPLLAASALLLAACSDSSAPPPPAEPTVVAPVEEPPALPQVPERTLQTIEGLFAGAQPGKGADLSTVPVLGFVETSEGLPVDGTWREHPLLADLNGDGLGDIAASNREEDGLNVWLRTRAGGWKLAIDGIPRTLMYGGIEAADLDHDGRTDLVFASHKERPRVLLNRPHPDDAESILWEEVPNAIDSSFLGLDVALGNINGDEHLDAVIIAQFVGSQTTHSPLAIFLGKGDGSFERYAAPPRAGKSRNGRQVELADFDGNGLDDIYVTGEWGVQLLLTTNDGPDGALRFEDHSIGLPKPLNIGNLYYACIPCDIVPGGPLELAFCGLADPLIEESERNDVGVYEWTGAAWVQIDRGLPRDLAYHDVLSADFDLDGHGDLLLFGPGIGVLLYRGDGTGAFAPVGMLSNSDAGGRGSLGDVNGDGRVDVVVGAGATKMRPEAGSVRVYLNDVAAFGPPGSR
ncbi:MAG: VCBS repeat-containing protein [Planctomycetes bacterium]|nr:VCBS repeat-containing protein [Planctomycetota bacterium]